VWSQGSIHPADMLHGSVAAFEVVLGSARCDGRGRNRREDDGIGRIIRSLRWV
jgi:hypothetical protein